MKLTEFKVLAFDCYGTLIDVSWDECVGYGRSIKKWPAFPDSVEALQYLKQHYKLAILSNVDNESFSANDRKVNLCKTY